MRSNNLGTQSIIGSIGTWVKEREENKLMTEYELCCWTRCCSNVLKKKASTIHPHHYFFSLRIVISFTLSYFPHTLVKDTQLFCVHFILKISYPILIFIEQLFDKCLIFVMYVHCTYSLNVSFLVQSSLQWLLCTPIWQGPALLNCDGQQEVCHLSFGRPYFYF